MPFEWIAAVRFLREGRLQSVLIVGGVAIGVAVIVFMTALLAGMQTNIIRRTLSAQAHIVLQAPERNARPLFADDADTLLLRRVQPPTQRLRTIDQWRKHLDFAEHDADVVAAAPIVAGPALAVRGGATRSVTVQGVEPQRYRGIIPLDDKLVSGDLRLGSTDIVIGTALAEDLGLVVGDRLRLTTSGGRDETYTIRALYDLGSKAFNRRTVFATLHTAQTLLGMPGEVSEIEINVREPFTAEIVAQRLQAATGLLADSWIKTNGQFVVAIRAQTMTSRTIRFFVGLSIAFGIASVLAVWVVQKQREIGILRAMGATRGQILRVFLIQGALVGLAGSLAGTALAEGFALIFRIAARNPDGTPLFPLDLSVGLFVWTAVLATVVGLLAALAPARRAARLDPVQAIRG